MARLPEVDIYANVFPRGLCFCDTAGLLVGFWSKIAVMHMRRARILEGEFLPPSRDINASPLNERKFTNRWPCRELQLQEQQPGHDS